MYTQLSQFVNDPKRMIKEAPNQFIRFFEERIPPFVLTDTEIEKVNKEFKQQQEVNPKAKPIYIFQYLRENSEQPDETKKTAEGKKFGEWNARYIDLIKLLDKAMESSKESLVKDKLMALRARLFSSFDTQAALLHWEKLNDPEAVLNSEEKFLLIHELLFNPHHFKSLTKDQCRARALMYSYHEAMRDNQDGISFCNIIIQGEKQKIQEEKKHLIIPQGNQDGYVMTLLNMLNPLIDSLKQKIEKTIKHQIFLNPSKRNNVALFKKLDCIQSNTLEAKNISSLQDMFDMFAKIKSSDPFIMSLTNDIKKMTEEIILVQSKITADLNKQPMNDAKHEEAGSLLAEDNKEERISLDSIKDFINTYEPSYSDKDKCDLYTKALFDSIKYHAGLDTEMKGKDTINIIRLKDNIDLLIGILEEDKNNKTNKNALHTFFSDSKNPTATQKQIEILETIKTQLTLTSEYEIALSSPKRRPRP